MYQPDAYSWTTRRFSPLSSTMRACRPARTVRRRFDRARLPVQTQQQGEGESGTLARNALHLSHDVHQLFGDRQPQACAAVAAGCRRVRLRKFLKQTVQFFPAQLPIPVSLIEIATHARFPSASPHLTAIKTWPDCVNLTALLARLTSICRTRPPSPRKWRGVQAGYSTIRSSLPSSVWGCSISATSSTTRRSNG